MTQVRPEVPSWRNLLAEDAVIGRNRANSATTISSAARSAAVTTSDTEVLYSVSRPSSRIRRASSAARFTTFAATRASSASTASAPTSSAGGTADGASEWAPRWGEPEGTRESVMAPLCTRARFAHGERGFGPAGGVR